MPDTDSKRDAVHVAIIPLYAYSPLNPGQRFYIRGVNQAAPAVVASDAIGIVDPFLNEPVAQGQMFWGLMNPGTVKDLRHAWSHPDVDDDAEAYDYDDSCRGC